MFSNFENFFQHQPFVLLFLFRKFFQHQIVCTNYKNFLQRRILYAHSDLENFLLCQIFCTYSQVINIFLASKFLYWFSRIKKFSPAWNFVNVYYKFSSLENFFQYQTFYIVFPTWKILFRTILENVLQPNIFILLFHLKDFLQQQIL